MLPRALKYWIRSFIAFGLGMSLLVATGASTLAARQIGLFFPPLLEFYLSIDDLATFAKTGEVSQSLEFYAQRVRPQQLADLRTILNQRFEVSPVTVSQFTYSTIGEDLLKELSSVIESESGEMNFRYIRAALLLAAAQPEGLTPITFLTQYGDDLLRFNLGRITQVVDEVSQLFQRRSRVLDALRQQASLAAQSESLPALGFGLNETGSTTWQIKPLRFRSPERPGPVEADLYLPQNVSTPVPFIVISHGVGSDRQTFSYLAQHLASQGFGVGVVQHPDTSSEALSQFLRGFSSQLRPRDWVERSQDVTALLDALEDEPLDLSRVGVIGQSLGGYTALALAGAKIDPEHLQQACRPVFDEDVITFNLSLLLQCQAVGLPTNSLRDERIAAAIAINPVNSALFGPQGMAEIQVPLMIMAGSEDFFAPPISEQVRPFTWLKTENKYLTILNGGTHFSYVGPSAKDIFPVPEGLIGPPTALAHTYLRALSTAFFKTYLLQQSDYARYLSPAYANQISQKPLTLTLVREWTAEQLRRAEST